MGYIGNQPAEKFSSFSKQTFSPDGSSTSFTLDYAVSGENELALFVNNVRQEPGSGKAYTASGTTLTMSEAPGSSDTMYGIFIGKAVQTVTPANASLTGAMMSYPLTNFSSTGIDDNATSTAISIDSSGSVGIKNTSPSHTLDISDNTTTAKTLRVGQSSGTSTVDATMIISNGGSGDAMLRFDYEGQYTDRARIGITGSGQNLQFFTAGNNERMRIDSNGDVSINTTSPQAKLHIVKNDAGALNDANSNMLMIENTTATGISIGSSTTGEGHIYFSDSADADVGGISYFHVDNSLRVRVNASERMRIDSSGNVLVGKTSTADVVGVEVRPIGYISIKRASVVLNLNRATTDGTIVNFQKDSVDQGSISVSGSTVSYNGFTGTHWSRLSDNSKPTILKGTILESLDEMMDWYQVQFDVTDTDDEGNEITTTHKENYALGDGESVGDVITYNFEGTDYQATIIQEDDVKHNKSKISDTVNAKNVYGVFMAWDNDDDTVNDMYVAQTGTFVVRMNSAETVSKGDLIQSNGDGTGKVQTDDIIRASTVAKILSTTKIETYEDGSYIVPCSLHC